LNHSAEAELTTSVGRLTNGGVQILGEPHKTTLARRSTLDTRLAEQIIRLEYLASQCDHKDRRYEAALEQAQALAYIASALEATKGLAA
jgi:hypothetical protein